MKKLFSLFILCLCFSTAWGHDVEVDGIYYNLNNEDKTARVTYRGDSYDSYENEYTGEVVIPETINVNGTQYQVTSLGELCFCGCSGLTSITFPNSVTSLEYGCFGGCSSLTSITIPNSVTSLGEFCFYSCSGLASITIPNSVTSVGDYCFSDAEYLIYCYQTIYNSLKEEYSERVVLCNTPSAIGNVEAETAAPTVVGYYDLSGRRLSGQQRGLNIIRYSDGTSRKVMVK